MGKVRFGIIGAGNMGSGHFKSFLEGKILNGEIAAIADMVPEKLEACRKKAAELKPDSDIRYFSSGDELIESKCCDAVIIAIPHYFHPEFAIKAMKNGQSALVEKPAGVYTLQVEEMLEEAKKHPELQLGIMFNQRTDPVFRKMKEMISEGKLGKITRLNWIITNWFRTESYYRSGGWRATWKGEGGGVLYNQAPHNIDLFQWIPGMMPCRVEAHCQFGKWHDIEVEDDVTAYFEYPNGATGVFITTTGDAPGTNRFEITGELGKLVFDLNSLKFYENEVSSIQFSKESKSGFSSPKCREQVIEVEANDVYHNQHVGILNNFANAILGTEPLYAPASDGINGVTLANAMLLSQWTGKMVDLPIDGKKFYGLLSEHIAASEEKKFTASDSGAVDLSDTFNTGKK